MSASIDSRWLVAALSKQVQDFVICAGSRSAPLTYAVADAEARGLVRAHPFFDERSAAFFALGLTQATGRPVAIVTTSGTAPAHILPAVIEAWHTGAPLIVLSADRPFEMHGVGASQTTTQSRLFDGHIVSFLDIPADLGIASTSRSISEDAAAKGLINRVRRLLSDSVGLRGKPGPAHINVQLRDPLVPAQEDPSVADLDTGAAKVVRPAVVATPWEDVVEPMRTVVLAGDKAGGGGAFSRGADVVGTELTTTSEVGAPETPVTAGGQGAENPSAIGATASELAVAAGVPLLAEPSSGAFGRPGWAPHQQQMISMFGDEIEQVVVLGHPSLSRPVSRLLARDDVRVVVVSEGREYTDVSGNADTVVEKLAPAREPMGGEWTESWAKRAAKASEHLGAQDLPDGVRVARAVWNAYAKNPDHVLVLGASNPIRYVDLVAAKALPTGVEENPGSTSDGDGEPGANCSGDAALAGSNLPGDTTLKDRVSTPSPEPAPLHVPVPAPVHAARGQAGIDGTIATMRGLSCGLKKPARALVGDLTFLHDLNSLAVRKGEDVPPIDVVLIDDGGGRIFKSLEHGEAPAEMYERFFAIGQQVDYEALAKAFGWKYVGVDFASAEQNNAEGDAKAEEMLEKVLAEAPSGRIIHVIANHENIRDELRNLFPENIQ